MVWGNKRLIFLSFFIVSILNLRFKLEQKKTVLKYLQKVVRYSEVNTTKFYTNIIAKLQHIKKIVR